MLEFLANVFYENVYLAVGLVSVIPGVESKIAISFGLSQQIWHHSNAVLVLLSAFLSSLVPCVTILLICSLIKKKVSGFVVERWFSKFKEKHKKIFGKLSEGNKTFKKCLALATFVAIPLPLTGVYTGSIIAGLTDLKFWQSFLAISIGELVSCLIIFLLCVVFENSAFYVFIISLVLLILVVALNLIINSLAFIKKKKRDNYNQTD